MTYTFLIPLSGFVIGIMSAYSFPGYIIPTLCIVFAFDIWITLRLLSNNPLSSLKFTKFHNLWVLFLFIGLGSLDYELNSRPFIEKDIDNQLTTVEGLITETLPLARGDEFKIKILRLQNKKRENINIRNSYLLVKTDGFCAVVGDKIKFSAYIHKFSNQTPAAIKYANRMNKAGVLYFTSIKSDYISKTGRDKSLKTMLHDFRDVITITIEKSTLSKNTRNFIISFLLGRKSYIDKKTRAIYNNGGVGHILALSGLHIGIILGICMFLFYPISFFGYPSLRKVLALLFIWVYVALTGMQPSAVRAAIMATFILMAYIFQRKNNALNALFAATFLILLFNPNSIWDIGFQFSFLSVASIIIFVDRLNMVERHAHPLMYKYVSLCLISIIATLATWILVAYYFKQIPLFFLPANLLIIPLLPFFMVLVIVHVTLLLFKINFSILSNFIDNFYLFIERGVDFLSLNGKSIISVNIEEISLYLWYISLFLVALSIFVISSRKRFVMRTLSGIFCLLAIFALFAEKANNFSSIRFLHSFTQISTVINEGEINKRLDFERNKNSIVQLGDISLWVIDNKITESLYDKLKEIFQEDKIYLYLGPKADLDLLGKISNPESFKMIILHPGIGKRMQERLTELIGRENEEKIYSLREKGSLELLL